MSSLETRRLDLQRDGNDRKVTFLHIPLTSLLRSLFLMCLPVSEFFLVFLNFTIIMFVTNRMATFILYLDPCGSKFPHTFGTLRIRDIGVRISGEQS